MSKWKKWTVVLEMNDGSLFAMRQKINTRNPGEVDILNAEAVDKDNVKRIAGNFPGWGPIPPIAEWNWHYSFAGEDSPANAFNAVRETPTKH